MSRFGGDYQVARPTGVCAATGRALDPGDAGVATLCERLEDDGLERQDFSADAWEAGARPERLFSFWKFTVPMPQTKKRLLVDDQVLLDLFERLDGDERPRRAAFRFVLGLVLLRKRLVRYVGRSRGSNDGREDRWLLLPRGATAEQPPIELLDPNLSDQDVRELTEQLGEILQGEL